MSAQETLRPLTLNEVLRMRKYFRHDLNRLSPRSMTAHARSTLVLRLIEDYLELRSKDKEATVEMPSEEVAVLGWLGGMS